MALARDYPSDYMRGFRNGAAAVLVSVGRDPRGVLEHEREHLVTDIVLPFAEFERLIAHAGSSNRRQAEVEQLSTALALLEAELQAVIQGAMGAEATREDPTKPPAVLDRALNPLIRVGSDAILWPDDLASRETPPVSTEDRFTGTEHDAARYEARRGRA